MGQSMKKKDLEAALEAERRSYWRALQKLDVRHHATNLLINDLVEWFSTRQTPDGNAHQFGIGVVLNADSPAAGGQAQHENLPIIFVLSTMATQDGTFRNMTVHELKDFRSLPDILSGESVRKSDLDLGALIREVTPLADQAYATYLRGRIRPVPGIKRAQ
jgi:hypothetical protein